MTHKTHRSQLAPGTFVTDRLMVVRRIGSGGLGEVYEVEHKFTRHHRALKILHPQFRQDADVVERFLREASAAGRIGNPHIVETFDAGYLEDGSPFIVMEFLEGKPLNEVLRWNGRLDVGLASAAMCQICTAVQAAHDANIIHRDLKPENLFVTERDGRAFIKVLDFGISKFSAEEGIALRQTGSGITMGTPLYMSPEQLRGAKNCDARSDVYSLGVILYEMVSGHVPFEANSFAELAVKVLSGEFAPLNVVDGAIPSQLSGYVTRALHKNPAERFQSARALGETLEPFSRNRSVSVLLHHEVLPAKTVPKEGGDTHVRESVSQPPSDAPSRATPAPAQSLVKISTPDARSNVEAPPAPGPGSSEVKSVQPRLLRRVGVALLAAALGGGVWVALDQRQTEKPPAPAPASEVRRPPPTPPRAPELPAPAVVASPPQPALAKPEAATPPLPPASKKPRSVKFGWVDIACQPVPCAVTIDGKSEGETPLLGFQLAEGSHDAILVNSETGAKQTRGFQVIAGQRTKVAVSY